MRISDWSSDVCSADLRDVPVELAVEVEVAGDVPPHRLEPAVEVAPGHTGDARRGPVVEPGRQALGGAVVAMGSATGDEVEVVIQGRDEPREQIGRASGRERGWQTV